MIPASQESASFFVNSHSTGLGRFNIIRGEMSIVGPRPDLESQLSLYDDLLWCKLMVRPGLTSVPAVQGRNSLSWRQRAALDSWYVDHRSTLLDLSIMVRTVFVVFQRAGIYTHDIPATAPEELAQMKYL